MQATSGKNKREEDTIVSPPNTQNAKDMNAGVNVYRVCNDLKEDMNSTVNLP